MLGGVPRVGSPASSLLLRHSDSSTPRLRFAFARLGRSARCRRRRGLPGSWATLVHMPCSLRPRWSHRIQDPGLRPAFRRDDVAFRHPNDVGLHDPEFFRGSITRPAHPLSTLRNAAHAVATQDSLPAGGPHPCRSGLEPAGCVVRFLLYVIASSSPRLRLAHRDKIRRTLRPPSHRDRFGAFGAWWTGGSGADVYWQSWSGQEPYTHCRNQSPEAFHDGRKESE